MKKMKKLAIQSHHKQLLILILLLAALLLVQWSQFSFTTISTSADSAPQAAVSPSSSIYYNQPRPELMKGMLYERDGSQLYNASTEPIVFKYYYTDQKPVTSFIPKNAPQDTKNRLHQLTVYLIAQRDGYVGDENESERKVTNRLLLHTARSVKHYAQSERVQKIVVVWNLQHSEPKISELVSERLQGLQADLANPKHGTGVAMAVVKEPGVTPLAVLKPRSFIDTSCVYMVRVGVLVDLKDLDYGYRMWKFFPNLLVGFSSNHKPRQSIDEPYDEPCSADMSIKPRSQLVSDNLHFGAVCLEREESVKRTYSNHPRQVLLSMVPATLTGSFIHRYYLDELTYKANQKAKEFVESHSYYLDHYVSQVISFLSQNPPILVKPDYPIFIPSHHFDRNPPNTNVDQISVINKISSLVRNGQQQIFFTNFKVERVALRDVT